MGIIGCLTGLVAFVVNWGMEQLLRMKYDQFKKGVVLHTCIYTAHDEGRGRGCTKRVPNDEGGLHMMKGWGDCIHVYIWDSVQQNHPSG